MGISQILLLRLPSLLFRFVRRLPEHRFPIHQIRPGPIPRPEPKRLVPQIQLFETHHRIRPAEGHPALVAQVQVQVHVNFDQVVLADVAWTRAVLVWRVIARHAFGRQVEILDFCPGFGTIEGREAGEGFADGVWLDERVGPRVVGDDNWGAGIPRGILGYDLRL